MKKILNLLLLSIISSSGLISSAISASAQQVASLMCPHNLSLPKAESRSAHAETDKAKVSALRRRHAALATYLQSILPSSADHRATEKAIKAIDGQILALSDGQAMDEFSTATRESSSPIGDGDRWDENESGDTTQTEGIKITSPAADATVHVRQYEIQVSVNDEDVDDIMVAVYTKVSGDKPAVAREMELKRSERGKKSFPVSLDEGPNRIEVSDLNRPNIKVTRTITYVPARDVLNAPPQANQSIFANRLRSADSDNSVAVICGQLQLSSLNRTFALIRSTPELFDLAARFRYREDPYRKNDADQIIDSSDYLGRSQLNDNCALGVDVPHDGLQRAAAIDLLKAVLLRLNSNLSSKNTQINNIAAANERAYLLENTTSSRAVQNEAKKANTAIPSQKNKRDSNGQIKTEDLWPDPDSSFASLSADTIRKQIVMLQQYLGNVEVRLMEGDNVIARTYTDRDGNFVFTIKTKGNDSGDSGASKGNSGGGGENKKGDGEGAKSDAATPSTTSASPVEYTVSTDGDDNNTKRKVIAAPGDRVRVNIEIEDKPVSLLVRTVLGFDQSGAASAKREQTYFVDFFISNTFPFRQRINPDFGERLRLWGDFRINSVPQPGGTAIGTFVSTFSQTAANVQVKDVARVFEFLGGVEYRLTGNNALLPSFDRQTKQKFSISAIGAFGAVTPLESPSIDSAPAIFKVFNDAPGLPPEAKGKDFVAFVPTDRDRFFRQYYLGLRVQTFFFNKYNVPMQRFPAQFDFTLGQNEFVTGGRLHGPVFRMEGFFPLPYEDYKWINLFASATMIPGHPNITTPLLLQPAPTGTVIQASNVAIIPVPQSNRDYYRIGVGIDAIPFFKKLAQGVSNATGSGDTLTTQPVAPTPVPTSTSTPTPSP